MSEQECSHLEQKDSELVQEQATNQEQLNQLKEKQVEIQTASKSGQNRHPAEDPANNLEKCVQECEQRVVAIQAELDVHKRQVVCTQQNDN